MNGLPRKENSISSTFDPTICTSDTLVSALVYLYDQGQIDNENMLCRIAEQAIDTHCVTEKQLTFVRSKLSKYRRYCIGAVIHQYNAVPAETKCNRAQHDFPKTERKTATISGNYLQLDFPYDEELIAKIKKIPGRQYDPKLRSWHVPSTIPNIVQLESFGFEIPSAANLYKSHSAVPITLRGLKKTLRPYQVTGINFLINQCGLRGLLADEMGLGKTPQAIAVINEVRNKTLPALIVCPGTLKYNWAREINAWIDNVTPRILSGFPFRTSYKLRENEITIVNFDVLSSRTNIRGQVARQGWAELLQNQPYKLLIIDESHNVKHTKTKRSQIVRKFAKDIPHIICLSGTPIENRPFEFFSTLSMIDSKLFPNVYDFAEKYCDGKRDNYGLNTKGSSNTEELYNILTRTIMIRRLKKDVLKELPPKVRIIIPVDIDDSAYRKAENELISHVAKLKGTEISKDKEDTALARVERLKQAAVLGKLPAAFEWISDYLQSGKKLVVFARHTFVIDALEAHFKGLFVTVAGKTPQKQRQVNVDRFQAENDIRLFFGNLNAAGTGITLTAASATLTLEFDYVPSKHDQAEDRVHRIGQDADSVEAYYMIARKTVEEEIIDILDQKRDILSQILNGEPVKDIDMLTELLKRFKRT